MHHDGFLLFPYVTLGNLTVSHPSLMLWMSACGSIKVEHRFQTHITLV